MIQVYWLDRKEDHNKKRRKESVELHYYIHKTQWNIHWIQFESSSTNPMVMNQASLKNLICIIHFGFADNIMRIIEKEEFHEDYS